jgi:pimeloyl-ACP methyl ester carboxylesterase
MQTVILPGYSPKNKEWADMVAETLTVEGQIRPVYWDHWLDAEQLFYPKEKATLIARHAKGDKINIVAHSIGTLVASYVVDAVPEQINKVILCGIPLHDISDEEKETIKNAVASLPKDKIVCYQNSLDSHGSFAEVKTFLPEGIKLVQKESSEHRYPYFEEFNQFLIA